jgi:glycosyltransferase involved in cell wall biosynthesis
MKKISWFSLNNLDASGERWFSQGYFNAALSTIKALQSRKCAVYYNREDLDFHVNFCPPHYYQKTSKYNVGYTPWESTKVPQGWISKMRECDEIWATSNFVKDVYEKNNVNANIYVIPHGISSEFSPIDREITTTFNFLHIGGDSKRKNAQLVVDAFLELFDGDLDYKLILKYNNYCYADVYIDGKIVPANHHPQILGIPSTFDTEQMASLYKKCHCLVYPTSGEGFGMIPFEAIATGMPTIVTNLTGCADFAELSIPLKATWGDSDYHRHLYSEDVGNWAIPDYDELLDLMQHVVNEYDEFRSYTMKSAKIVHAEWSWEATADKILARLESYEKSFA